MEGNHEILDALDNTEEFSNSRNIKMILLISLGTLLCLLAIPFIRKYLPIFLIDNSEKKFNTIGTIMILIIIVDALLLPEYFNNLIPQLSRVKILVFVGLTLMLVITIFKLFQNFMISYDLHGINYTNLFLASITISILGAAISNIRLQKLRNKKITTPILIFVLTFIAIGYILQNI